MQVWTHLCNMKCSYAAGNDFMRVWTDLCDRKCSYAVVNDFMQVLTNLLKFFFAGSTKPIDVYVNVEPCVMCACALSKIPSVRSVFFGCRNPRFGGCGTVLNVQKILQVNFSVHLQGF